MTRCRTHTNVQKTEDLERGTHIPEVWSDLCEVVSARLMFFLFIFGVMVTHFYVMCFVAVREQARLHVSRTIFYFPCVIHR